MLTPAIELHQEGDQVLALAAIRMRRLHSDELFREQAMLQAGAPLTDLSQACHDRWTDICAGLTELPTPVELALVVGSRPAAPPAVRDPAVVGVVAIGRGPDAEQASAACRRGLAAAWTILVTALDYGELDVVETPDELAELTGHLRPAHAVELRRRVAGIRLGPGGLERVAVGFEQGATTTPTPVASPTVEHLFPWVPSDDPWRRLLEALDAEPEAAALVVHATGLDGAPAQARDQALAAMAAADELAHEPSARTPRGFPLPELAGALQAELLDRFAILEGPVLAARVFLTGAARPSDGLVAVASSSVDDASLPAGRPAAARLFRGGTDVVSADPDQVLARLRPGRRNLFGPREATAVLRTPMPGPTPLPGLPLNRARTAAFTGASAGDATLGTCVHRGVRLPVALDPASRFRHTYVIGQTGTGKSTLLLNMLAHDMRAGRGVAVLDPHGSLVEAALALVPPERIDDVVLLDVTDLEHPVGFNPLLIEEGDPLSYRRLRDLVIDEIHAHLERWYARDTMGPIFETHFRAMFSLLLGVKQPAPPLTPNMLAIRILYKNADLRKRLVDQVGTEDLMVSDIVQEMEDGKYDSAIENLAPYVTSKFTRFAADLALRNITCQRRSLDLGAVVEQGRILLAYLGKGRFGDQAAGLLAGQLVSRLRWEVMKRGGHGRPLYLYADEFQLFADARFAELLAEARKFGLALTLAHQYAEQLPDGVLEAVLGNVGTTVCFRVGANDAAAFERVFAPTFSARDLAFLPNYRAYVRGTGDLGSTPFSVQTAPPPDGADPTRASIVRTRSAHRYGRPRAEVEAELQETIAAYRATEPKAKPPRSFF